MSTPNNPYQHNQPPYDPNQGPQPGNQPPYDPSQLSQPGNQPAYDPSLSPYGGPSSGSYPAQGPQTGGQPAWGQQPAWDQQQYGQQGYGAPAGFGGPPPPPSNKKPLIIGGAILAVLAIAATVLIIVLNKDDKKTDAGGGEGGSSGGSESSLTCGPDDYGIKIDPQTGKSVTCEGSSTGGDSKMKEQAKILTGTWKISGKVKSASEPITLEDGTKINVGDNPFNSSATWSFIPSPCIGSGSCMVTVTDEIGNVWSLEYEDGKWTGDTSFSLYCDSTKTDKSTINVEYEFTEVSDGTVKGTRELKDFGQCGTEFSQSDEVTLTK